MPNCNCCQHGFTEMDLQNQKCQNCQLKRIVEINEQLRTLSAQNQQNAEMREQDLEEYLENVEQYIKYINFQLQAVNVRNDGIKALCEAIESLHTEFIKLRYPNDICSKLLDAQNRALGEDPAPDQDRTKNSRDIDLS